VGPQTYHAVPRLVGGDEDSDDDVLLLVVEDGLFNGGGDTKERYVDESES